MLRKLTIILISVLLSNLLIGQACPVLNENGSFEEMIFVPGGEASIGITTGQISNWFATHGTVDYVTEDWNWYAIEGINSVGAHMCYGHRETHDHSEGMFTPVSIHGDDDLLYTLSLDFGTVCDSEINGFLNIALNSNLEEGGHNWFQFPTPEVFPGVFQEIQPIDRMELMPSSNIEVSGMSSYQISFVPESDFEQIWMFTEYQHLQDDFVSCGIVIDNVKLTATTSALTGINVEQVTGDNFQLTPQFSKDLDIVSYNWSVGNAAAGTQEELIHNFTEGVYTICLDVVDSRGACGATCHELDLTATQEEDTDPLTCTYSTCLDANGLPNLISFEYLAANGDIVIINENTEGFFFPYCDGTPSMCNGGESEVELFVEDLNAYFYNNSIEARVSSGDSANLFESTCRSLAVTIESSEIIPTAVMIDDFSVDQVYVTIAEFVFDPNNCGSNVTEESVEYYAFNSDDTYLGNGRNIFKPVVVDGHLAIEVTENEELSDEVEQEGTLVSEVVIYTLGGNIVESIDDFQKGDEINVNYLPTGMYVVNLVNKEEQKSGFFFVGDK